MKKPASFHTVTSISAGSRGAVAQPGGGAEQLHHLGDQAVLRV